MLSTLAGRDVQCVAPCQLKNSKNIYEKETSADKIQLVICILSNKTTCVQTTFCLIHYYSWLMAVIAIPLHCHFDKEAVQKTICCK